MSEQRPTPSSSSSSFSDSTTKPSTHASTSSSPSSTTSSSSTSEKRWLDGWKDWFGGCTSNSNNNKAEEALGDADRPHLFPNYPEEDPRRRLFARQQEEEQRRARQLPRKLPSGIGLCNIVLAHVLKTDQQIGNLLAEIHSFPECRRLRTVCTLCNKTPQGQVPCAHYNQRQQVVSVCANALLTESEARKSLLHELIHVYDGCRHRGLYSSCKLRACTEVRAAKLADCGHLAPQSPELERCTFNSALLSTKEFCATAKEDVRWAMDTCFNDHHPHRVFPSPSSFAHSPTNN
ncbi:Mitochondrial inner membrane protease ATP23 [Balamuthia mandrillaris]